MDRFLDDRAKNRARILLYWGVIGLVSQSLPSTIEDLAIVVLAHELAHAYTQLGSDIEGFRWSAQAFSHAEVSLKEGLAQYYTYRVLRRLAQRGGNALQAFEAMLRFQPPAYRTHEQWVRNFSPEAVRRAVERRQR